MPRLTLILLLLLAACVAGGGVIAARRVVEVRVERDRTAQRELVATLHAETRRLEQLYEDHLRSVCQDLTATMWETTEGKTREIAQGVTGIQRVSWLLPRIKVGPEERHVHIGPPLSSPPPEPTLKKEHSGRPRPRVLLNAEMQFSKGSKGGWIDEVGKPLFYVARLGDDGFLALTIDRSAVRAAMTVHLLEMPSVALALRESDEFWEDGEAVLHREVAVPQGPPDVLMGISSRFGAWQLASWDVRESRVSYHMPILTAGMALGVLIVLGGLALHEQQRRAAKLAAQRVSFVNRVSHELRTPMTNILLNLDVIEESLPEASAGRFGLIREEAGRLSRLIENVLTFSRKEEGRLKLQNAPCKPVEVVERVLRQFEPALKRRGISVTQTHEGANAEIMLDADALAQITANLLSNIEKYAPDAPARLHSVQNEREFTLTISDEGPGIAEKDAERIFEPFERLDDRVSAGVSGAGLGLSIARDLATRMGGELKLVRVEKGACFEFSLTPSPTPPRTSVNPCSPTESEAE